jgi:hypothetical protein
MSKASDLEDEFVERYRKQCGGLSHSTELALRAGFAYGYDTGIVRGVRIGSERKRREIADALAPDPAFDE